MGKGNPKKPKIGQRLPEPGKRPRIAVDPQSFYTRYPSWRVSKMEMVDPFGWHVLDAEKLDYIRRKLADFEGRTWGEILNSQHNHNVLVEMLSKDARDRLEEMKQGDLDELLSIRLSGAERVWGILRDGVCTLIWWDPDHQVCPSMKK